MTHFKGFETFKEALEFQKSNPEYENFDTKLNTDEFSKYNCCVLLGGLDPNRYPIVLYYEGK